jgi:hypothetical protein
MEGRGIKAKSRGNPSTMLRTSRGQTREEIGRSARMGGDNHRGMVALIIINVK